MTTRGPARHPVVLLVNDDVDTLDMYQVGLTVYGFDAFTARASADALQTCGSVAPDLVVADVPLTGTRGWRLIERLKSARPSGAVPVVVLTGDADPAIQSRAYQLGCAAVLLKPCAPDELAAVARQLLQGRPATHAQE